MKNCIRQLNIIFGFLLLTIIFSSCEKDFENEKIVNSKSKILIQDFSIKKNNIEEKNSKLLTSINKIKEKNNLQKQKTPAKMVYNSVYDFYFDDEKGKYIDVNGVKSFTFPVYRDSIEDKVENIVFKLNNDNDYDILLVKYGFTKEELLNLTEEEIKNYSLNITTIQSKLGADCGTYIVMCNNDNYGGYSAVPHVAGPGCHHAGNGNHLFTEWVPGVCDGDTGDTGTSGGSYESNNNGSSGGNPNPVITVPVLPCISCIEHQMKDPCMTLSNLLNPSIGNARQKILDVQSAGEGFN